MQKKVPYVAQLGNMDCSIACMTMLFRYYGLDVDIVDVGQVVHIGRDGVNLTQLKQATQQFGFKCTAYRYNKQKNILDSNLPAVVYSGSHLAVIGSKTVLGQYILLDPIKGKSIVNFEQIHDTFSDILITIRPEKRIKRKKCKPKLKVAINYKLVAGIISLMLLIQALTLSIPLVEQALIDSITQSQSLLNSAYILVGCIVIAGLYFFLSIARQKLMLRLDISFVKEIMTKMLKKLFDIDPSFFEWHAVGEIVNRFSNVQAINNIIINTFSQVAVQIITSTICLVTMFVYSPSLSVITIAIGTIELVLLLGINKKNREDTSKYIADQSNMQGLLAEAIGNIIEIRCMGMEKAIYKNLTNQFLDELESFRKKSNTGNQMLAISSTITLIFPLIIYILGYSSVVNEALTIGQLIAYVTLANYFISPFVSIVIALPNLNFVYEVFLRYKELITYRETHKNGVIGGQQYEDLPSGYYDYDVLKYWEKMIGQEAISCLPQAYGKQINELLFFNNQLNQDYKDSVKIQQVDEMIKLYRENVWKEQSILFHGERDLIFYTFSIPFIQCASFALIHRVSEIIVRCVLKDMQQMLAQRLSAVATGTLMSLLFGYRESSVLYHGQ